MSFLERVKEKPSHVKARYAFFGAAGVTTVVALFWVVSLPAQFAGVGGAQQDTSDSENTRSAPSERKRLSEILESTEKQVGSAANSLNERESFSSTTTTSGVRALDSTEDTAASSSSSSASTSESARASSSVSSEPRTVLIATTSSEKNEQKSQ